MQSMSATSTCNPQLCLCHPIRPYPCKIINLIIMLTSKSFRRQQIGEAQLVILKNQVLFISLLTYRWSAIPLPTRILCRPKIFSSTLSHLLNSSHETFLRPHFRHSLPFRYRWLACCRFSECWIRSYHCSIISNQFMFMDRQRLPLSARPPLMLRMVISSLKPLSHSLQSLLQNPTPIGSLSRKLSRSSSI